MQPLELGCPACNGDGCEVCGGIGWFKVESCPRHHVAADIAEGLRLLDFAKQGVLPVAGGYYDQTPAFLELMTLYEREAASHADS